MTQLVTIPEAAKILSLSPKTLWHWCYTGQLVTIKINGNRRVKLSTLQEMIDAGEHSGPGRMEKCRPGNRSTSRRPGRPRKEAPLAAVAPETLPMVAEDHDAARQRYINGLSPAQLESLNAWLAQK